MHTIMYKADTSTAKPSFHFAIVQHVPLLGSASCGVPFVCLSEVTFLFSFKHLYSNMHTRRGCVQHRSVMPSKGSYTPQVLQLLHMYSIRCPPSSSFNMVKSIHGFVIHFRLSWLVPILKSDGDTLKNTNGFANSIRLGGTIFGTRHYCTLSLHHVLGDSGGDAKCFGGTFCASGNLLHIWRLDSDTLNVSIAAGVPGGFGDGIRLAGTTCGGFTCLCRTRAYSLQSTKPQQWKRCSEHFWATTMSAHASAIWLLPVLVTFLQPDPTTWHTS